MRAPLLILLVTLGCGSDLLAPDFAQRLTQLGGCGDVIFFAVDPDDQVMVTFHMEGLVAAARNAETETSTVVVLPSDDVELILQRGSRVSDATCDDVIENSGPQIQQSWTARAGTATVRIRPEDDPSGTRGDLVLEDVLFGADDADDVALEHLEWTDVSVGWYAG